MTNAFSKVYRVPRKFDLDTLLQIQPLCIRHILFCVEGGDNLRRDPTPRPLDNQTLILVSSDL